MARLQPAESRLERRKARTVAAILDAAERHFLERGYESARVDEIAADADVAVGSIYNHFGSKEGVYGALVERALDVFLTYMEEPEADRKALERVLDSTGRLARFARERPAQMRMLVHRPGAVGDQDLVGVLDRVRDAMADQERRTAALIEAAVRRGEARAVNSRDAAAFLWSAWKGMLTLGPRAERAAPGSDRELRALIEAALRIVVGGLASDAARDEDETVRAILESAPSRAVAEEPAAPPLALRRAAVADDLRDQFAELALWTGEVNASPRESPKALRQRLEGTWERLGAAAAIGTREESTPWAYRVFARRAGIDPDDVERAVEAVALERPRAERVDSAGLPDDALLVAVAATGVPVLAFDADRIDGELWLRRARPGESLGAGGPAIEPGRPILADRTRPVAVPFGAENADAAVSAATQRMALAALQVKGVPDMSVEEALWTAIEIVRESS
jgi:AcrR family transcriptional regulator/DNA/RNA-binding domain of Phe-tRNA-synthetase-like protein